MRALRHGPGRRIHKQKHGTVFGRDLIWDIWLKMRQIRCPAWRTLTKTPSDCVFLKSIDIISISVMYLCIRRSAMQECEKLVVSGCLVFPLDHVSQDAFPWGAGSLCRNGLLRWRPWSGVLCDNAAIRTAALVGVLGYCALAERSPRSFLRASWRKRLSKEDPED